MIGVTEAEVYARALAAARPEDIREDETLAEWYAALLEYVLGVPEGPARDSRLWLVRCEWPEFNPYKNY